MIVCDVLRRRLHFSTWVIGQHRAFRSPERLTSSDGLFHYITYWALLSVQICKYNPITQTARLTHASLIVCIKLAYNMKLLASNLLKLAASCKIGCLQAANLLACGKLSKFDARNFIVGASFNLLACKLLKVACLQVANSCLLACKLLTVACFLASCKIACLQVACSKLSKFDARNFLVVRKFDANYETCMC